VRVRAGDAMHLAAAAPARLRGEVRTLTLCQVANEMFGGGGRAFVDWLCTARRLF